jgi:uncharacterized protein with PQ loop repeat
MLQVHALSKLNSHNPDSNMTRDQNLCSTAVFRSSREISIMDSQDQLISPMSYLRYAVSRISALEWALGVGALVAVLKIASRYELPVIAMVLGTLTLLLFMVALYLVSQLVRPTKKSYKIPLASLVILWTSVSLFVIASGLTTISFFFDTPLPLKTIVVGPVEPDPIPDKFPDNENEKKTVDETLKIIELKLASINSIYSWLFKAWDKAEDYLASGDPDTFVNLYKYIKFAEGKIAAQKAHNQRVADSLKSSLTMTPLSVEDVSVLYDYVNVEVDSTIEKLDFLLVILNPDMPFDKTDKKKWLAIRKEQFRLSMLIFSYAVCEFLLPIDHNYLNHFRTVSLPKFTAFDGEGFNFSLDKTQLIQLQEAAEKKRMALEDDLGMIVGEANLTLAVYRARLKEMEAKFDRIVNERLKKQTH